jgi:predicted branched-subunit amino acid permease
MLQRGHDAREGALAIAPFVIGLAPLALVIGSVVASIDTPVAGWAGSWLIFGGSAHLAALDGIGRGGVVVAIISALLINARLVVYGTSLAPRWRTQPLWFRAVAGALLVDPTWALADQHLARGTSEAAHRRYYLGAALTLAIGWSATIAAGAIVGNQLPALGLDVAVPLSLIALLGPRLRDRQHRWAAVAAGAVMVVARGWPPGSGILAAIVAGSLAAALAERLAA